MQITPSSFYRRWWVLFLGLVFWQRRGAPLRGGCEGASGQAVARRSPPSQPLGAPATRDLGAAKVMDGSVSCLPPLLPRGESLSLSRHLPPYQSLLIFSIVYVTDFCFVLAGCAVFVAQR